MINIKKNSKKKEYRISIGRTIIIALACVLAFIYVIMNLFRIQFIEGKKWSDKARASHIIDQLISPNRGTIYDSNGEILAQSISVDTISLNPGKVTYSNGKKVDDELLAKGLSEIFDVTEEEMLERLKSGKSVVFVEKKVEQDKVDALLAWMHKNKISAGINIDEDSRRYYPYESLASNLLGFCGTDNSGQTGIEQRWNNVLTGTAGKIKTTVDRKGQAISDEDEQYIASENGSNIYLTIDTRIQAIVEKYLKKAIQENPSSKGGTAVVMNPKTGEILAMASYPDFNLNTPYSFEPTGKSEEEWKALEQVDRTSLLLNLWKNKAVSGTYEPGSTFKLITASVGLEEAIVQTDTPGDFYCSGKYTVADYDIACWRSYNPHGSQSLRESLENSCNPAFMQLGQRIGAKTLYKYYKAFGFLEPIGSDIAKAYSGQFYELDKLGPVELATASFGQRFEISPLQLISAVSAICNDGQYVKPRIIKRIENTDTGSIEIKEPEVVRQVISKDTADKIKDMMRSVVTDGTGKNAAVEGYSIGGKSGTSEPRDNKKEEGYVASFIAISPIENTQVVALVTVNGLSESQNHQGGQVAGPVCHEILSEVLPYLGVSSTSTENKPIDDSKLISVPNVKNMTVAEAMKKLQGLGFNINCDSASDQNTTVVTDQVPKFGIALKENSVICLYTSDSSEKKMVTVPNVKNMTAQQAETVLRQNNLNIQIDGDVGIVVTQDPSYEVQAEAGSVVNVVIKEELVDAQ